VHAPGVKQLLGTEQIPPLAKRRDVAGEQRICGCLLAGADRAGLVRVRWSG
jgi:hypothetical protein